MTHFNLSTKNLAMQRQGKQVVIQNIVGRIQNYEGNTFASNYKLEPAKRTCQTMDCNNSNPIQQKPTFFPKPNHTPKHESLRGHTVQQIYAQFPNRRKAHPYNFGTSDETEWYCNENLAIVVKGRN